jgi:glycosyltransferase involved in cell wall biosynthesis
MRIGFVVERPTQFEAPFFRFAAADPEHRLRVLYTAAGPDTPVFDPELGRTVSWGFDLLAGYDHAVLPPRGRVRWLARELRVQEYDLLVVNGYTRPAYLLAAALARAARVPTALRLDSVRFASEPALRPRRRLLVSAGLARGFDLFLGVGTLTLEYLQECGVPPERTGLFPYAVDVDGFRDRSSLSPVEHRAQRERLGVPAEARVVLAVAKHSTREAPWDLLRAAAGLPDDVWILLAGDGPDRPALESFAREHGLSRVRFLGYVPYPDLPALYAASDLFVHAAREERWGVSVQEALACGLPVVASSRVGAARDLIGEGRNGYVYHAGDAVDLADRLTAGLDLDRDQVREHTLAVLARWDYPATWAALLQASDRAAIRRDILLHAEP